jgi:hypothetical protein
MSIGYPELNDNIIDPFLDNSKPEHDALHSAEGEV